MSPGERSARETTGQTRCQITWSDPLRIKIYGERNTGTSFLERLLVRNLQVDPLRGGIPNWLRSTFPNSEIARDWYFRATQRGNLGWKHASAPSAQQLANARVDATRVVFVSLTRNPYAWLLSLYRRPYHSKREYASFDEFLCEPWRTVGREGHRKAFANPIVMWNEKNASYLALGRYATTIHCRYEDLLADPFDFLERLCREKGVAARLRPFQNVEQAVKGRDRGKTFEDYRDYYLNERWRDALDARSLALINERLDPDVLSEFKYPMIATGS